MTDTAIINRALELVRDGLRSGQIPAHNFDFLIWRAGKHCGTRACIGGWAELALQHAGYDVSLQDLALNHPVYFGLADLFYDNPFAKVAPSAAAAAIDDYLARQPAEEDA